MDDLTTGLSRPGWPAHERARWTEGTGDAPSQGVPRTIDRHDVQELVASGAQLVDVRDRDDYEKAHIVGAIALPLKELTREAARRALDVSRPIITYCHDYE